MRNFILLDEAFSFRNRVYNSFNVACLMDYFQLPSGNIYCRVPSSIEKNFADSQAFCKSIGFTGLAEFKNDDDATMIAGINECEF